MRIGQQGFWWRSLGGPPAPRPALREPIEADVAIVGAGFTGLWTAIRLKELEPALDVVVLEQGTAAYGASGRNAGMLSEGIDHSHALAIAHFGRDEARRLAALGQQNLAELVAFLEGHGIECSLERTGMLHVALLASQVAELEQDALCARSLGVEHLRLLDRDAVRAELHCQRYEAGLLNPQGGVLDPVELVEGLKREAARRGVTVYERSRVTALMRAGAGIRLDTEHGSVVARKAILGTSAYTHQLLPCLRFRFIPFYDYIIASEPLTPAQRELLGWRNRQGVTDVRTFFKYYRLTVDDRIVWGTSEAAYYSGNRVDPACDHSERHYRELRESFVRHFPALRGLEFPHAWGGAICATTRFTPFFGAALGGRVLYGLGFTGHGIGTTHLAGKILAHLALARPSPLLELQLVTRQPFPYPPEPLRSWAVASTTRALRRVDAGGRPSLLLRLLDALGIGLSS